MFKTAVLALGLAAAAAAAAVSEEDPARMIEEAETRAADVMAVELPEAEESVQ